MRSFFRHPVIYKARKTHSFICKKEKHKKLTFCFFKKASFFAPIFMRSRMPSRSRSERRRRQSRGQGGGRRER